MATDKGLEEIPESESPLECTSNNPALSSQSDWEGLVLDIRMASNLNGDGLTFIVFQLKSSPTMTKSQIPSII